jgi:hypothetical protein
MKNGLKMKFEKEKKKKKKNSAGFLSAAQAAHQTSPRRPTSPLLLFFFPHGADIRGPPVSLPSHPFPFFFLSPSNRAGAAARSPPRPAASPPSFPLPAAN